MTVKIAWFGDVHSSVRGVSSRKSYVKDMQRKFDQICEIDEKLKPDFWGCPGDWFHSKSKTQYRDVSVLAEFLSKLTKRCGIPVMTVLGNHDIVGDNVGSWRDQPIGILHSAGLVCLVSRAFVSVSLKNGKTCCLNGIDFDRSLTNSAALVSAMRSKTARPNQTIGLGVVRGFSMTDRPDADYYVTITHCDVGSSFTNPYSDKVPRLFVNGHLHDTQRFSSSDNTAYLWTGSLMRTSRNDSAKGVEPSVFITKMSESGTTCRKIELSITPDDQVFKEQDESVLDLPEHNEALRDFLESVSGVCDDSKSMSLVDIIRSVADANKESGYSYKSLQKALSLLESSV